MTLIICGTITAAAAPCTNLKKIRARALGANPHASEVTVKPIAPSRYIRRRP